MGFTERQKTEFKIMAKEIISEMISDELFVNSLAKKVADKVGEQLTMKINNLESQINMLQAENQDLRVKIEEMEQIQKLDKLRIYGVKEENSENIKCRVEEILSAKMDLSINLVECYRIGKRQIKENKPRVIIMKFQNIHQRNQVFSKKKNLIGTKMMITEELIKSRFELLMLAKEKLGSKNVWSVGGKLYTMVHNKKFQLENEDSILNVAARLSDA